LENNMRIVFFDTERELEIFQYCGKVRVETDLDLNPNHSGGQDDIQIRL
jgi:hypothetical protein